MLHIFIINEFTAWRFVLLALFRREVFVFKVEPTFPPLRRFLDPVAAWALGTGRARYLIDRFPDLQSDWDNPDEGMRHDTFRKIEPWQDKAFRFDEFPDSNPYGRAYRHLTCKYLWFRYPVIFLLFAVGREMPPGKYRVYGVSDDTLGLLDVYFGGRGGLSVKPQWTPDRLFNALISIAVTLYTLGWILTRLRPIVKPQEVFFAADFHGDWRDRHLYEELDDIAPLLFVPRITPIPEIWKPGLKGNLVCHLHKGFFDPLAALQTMAMAIADVFSLYLDHGGRNLLLFYDIATMPYRRALMRGLFNRFRPRYFWGRDDYQVEHILRRQELHRVGGKSYGISHAVQGICIVLPSWRYISFDTYFVLGKRLSEFYKDTWAPDMETRPVGTFGFSRAQLTRPRTPSKTILIMLRYYINNPEYVRMIRTVAEAFPDYKVLLQVKLSYPHDRLVPALIEAVTKDRPNVVYTTDSVYDLMPKAAYVLADASTVVAEAIQIGIPTQMLDVIPDHETCVFRQFPDLCRTNARDLVKELKALESGEKIFTRDAYADLVDVSDTIIYDQIRQDMGLAPQAKT